MREGKKERKKERLCVSQKLREKKRACVYVFACVCVCLCVCACDREKERVCVSERQTKRVIESLCVREKSRLSA